MRTTLLAVATLLALALLPGSASAAVCADYSNQAAAQRAADTRDADHDGIYCESLPCPCLRGGSSPPPPPPPPPPATPKPKPKPKPKSSVKPKPSKPATTKPAATCSRPKAVQRLRLVAATYPNVKAHVETAIVGGWPRVMVLNRPGAAARSRRLLANIPSRAGFGVSEYPSAFGRGRAYGSGRGLIRGRGPIGWIADPQYVPSAQKRSFDAAVSKRLRKLCNGVRFTYVFTGPSPPPQYVLPLASG